MSPHVRDAGFAGDDDVVAALGPDAEGIAEEIEIGFAGGSEDTVVVADAFGEADPCFDGEGAFEGDGFIDEGIVVTVEDEDRAEGAAHFLHEGFECGVVLAEDRGDFLEGGAVEFVTWDRLRLHGRDDGGGTVLEAAEGVEGAAALSRRELRPEWEELIRGGGEAGEGFLADVCLR